MYGAGTELTDFFAHCWPPPLGQYQQAASALPARQPESLLHVEGTCNQAVAQHLDPAFGPTICFRDAHPGGEDTHSSNKVRTKPELFCWARFASFPAVDSR